MVAYTKEQMDVHHKEGQQLECIYRAEYLRFSDQLLRIKWDLYHKLVETRKLLDDAYYESGWDHVASAYHHACGGISDSLLIVKERIAELMPSWATETQ